MTMSIAVALIQSAVYSKPEESNLYSGLTVK